MRFIDFFAGIGGFRCGLELAGHKCVGFCEWDKFATASYTSMHLLTDDQRKKLEKMTLKQRQKEILKDEYRNGEWYASDIRDVESRNIPESECWCFGAPCQDFSVAGKRAGLNGDRSSLIREIFRLLEEQEEESRPEWLIYENVKGMLSSNRGLDYLSILSEMDRLGYDVEWQNIHTEWFLPQHRERIYTIGHIRRCGSEKIFPIQGTNGENSEQLTGRRVELQGFVDINYGAGIKETKCARTLQSRYYKGVCGRTGESSGVGVKTIGKLNSSQDGKVVDVLGISKCHTAGHNNTPKIAIPVITPERQNGRRFKENAEPMYTLTAQDRHGVGVSVQETEICEKNKKGIYAELPSGTIVYCVWYEKYQCYLAIRKLTPKECFRLQGWSDDYFEKAAFVNSDSQLYKQAGNGVTVNVVEEIGRRIRP